MLDYSFGITLDDDNEDHIFCTSRSGVVVIPGIFGKWLLNPAVPIFPPLEDIWLFSEYWRTFCGFKLHDVVWEEGSTGKRKRAKE